MIVGAHVVVYSTNAEADRAFLRDALKLPNVDVGGGWLIFSLPPSEVAFHPAQANGRHELFFLVDDVNAFISAMSARNVPCSAIATEAWGLLTQVTLPGGGKLGVYQPRHARPKAARVRSAAKPAAKKPKAKKPAGKAKAQKQGQR